MLMYRHFPGRMMGGSLIGMILTVLVVVGIVLLIVFLASRKNKIPNASAALGAAPAAQDRFVAILNEQRAVSGMGAAEYEERRLVLEGGRTDNHANAEIVALKERYARGELTTGAYVEERNKLLGLG